MKRKKALNNAGIKLPHLTTFIFTLFICHVANAQLTEKDFKLLLDGKDYSNDTTISAAELLKIKQVTANFSWLTVQEFSVFIDYRSNADTGKGFICRLPGLAACPGTTICEHARALMKDLKPGNIVVFSAEKAVNKSGYLLKMSELALRIR